MKYKTESELRSEFLGHLGDKLECGARDYGNESFYTPPLDTPNEILAEVIDVAGWAYVMWVKMQLRMNQIELAAEPFVKEPLDNGESPE